MISRCDARTLYALCTSTDHGEVHEGFQRLGECLLPVARSQLNEQDFDHAVVQDCVQEALQAIWLRLKQDRGPQMPEAFLAFAVQITRHRCIDRYRYEKRRASESLEAAQGEDVQPTAALGSSPELLPEHLVILDEAKTTLLVSIHHHPKLTDRAKSVLIEGYLFEKTDAELAQELSTTEGNIRIIRCRGLKLLRTDETLMAALRAHLTTK